MGFYVQLTDGTEIKADEEATASDEKTHLEIKGIDGLGMYIPWTSILYAADITEDEE